MSTRAKFYVTGLTLLPGKDAGVTLNLAAVGRGDRNADWAAATPSGNMQMTINNPKAVEWWESFMQTARSTGKQPELFIDIYPSADGWPGDGHPFRAGEGNPGTCYGPDYCGECGLRLDQSVAHGEKAHPNG